MDSSKNQSTWTSFFRPSKNTAPRPSFNKPLLDRSPAFLVVVTVAAYLIAGFIGYAAAPISVSSLWPPAAVGLAAVLLAGYWIWPAVWLSATTVTTTILLSRGVSFLDTALPTAAASAVGNTLEAVLAAYLVRRYAASPGALFQSPVTVAKFILFGGILPPFVSALIGVGSFVAGGQVLAGSIPRVFLSWWLGNASGILIFTPLILVWIDPLHRRVDWSRAKRIEAAAIITASTIITALAFWRTVPIHGTSYFLFAIALFPLLLRASHRFRMHGAASTTALIASLAAAGTTHGYGPFAGDALVMGELHIFLVIFSSTVLFHAAQLLRTDEVQAALRNSQTLLEQRVVERTETVRKERDFSQRLLNTIGSPVVLLNSQGRMVRCNPACERLSGYPASELKDKVFWELFSPADEAAAVRATFEGAMSSGTAHDTETHWLTKDGISKTIYWSQTRFDDPDQHASFIIGAGIDITKLKDAEGVARHLHERLSLAVESAQMVAWDWNLRSGSISWIGEMGHLYGTKEDDVRRSYEAFLEAIVPEDRDRVRHAVEQSTAQGLPLHVEYRIRTPLGDERWLLSKGETHKDSGGRPVRMTGIAMDITRRKLLDEEKNLVLEQTRKAVATREEFISIASHELKTPLTPLKLQLDLLKKALFDRTMNIPPERLREIFKSSEQQLNRLISLVDTLLDVSRVRAGRWNIDRREFDLSALVQDAVERVRSQEGARMAPIRLNLEPGVYGQWDRLRLEQVVTNLVTNALKYGRARPVTVTVSSKGDTAVVVVRDEGIGIRAEDRERIFQRFERAVSFKSFAGLGLGLYITREIIEAHGGSITIDSEPGKGATFTVTLPRHLAALQATG